MDFGRTRTWMHLKVVHDRLILDIQGHQARFTSSSWSDLDSSNAMLAIIQKLASSLSSSDNVSSMSSQVLISSFLSLDLINNNERDLLMD